MWSGKGKHVIYSSCGNVAELVWEGSCLLGRSRMEGDELWKRGRQCRAAPTCSKDEEGAGLDEEGASLSTRFLMCFGWSGPP